MNFPKSFFANGLHCGIKKNSNNDLSVFYSYKPCIAAGMFTTNIFRAAPVIVSEKNIKNKIYAIIANSGCANACTGERGIKDAMAMCEMTAKKINVKAENVLVASTGVIGQFLPINKIENGINKIMSKNIQNTIGAVRGIMTTDTFPKIAGAKFKIGNSDVCIWGCAKGSGMIEPNTATMLSFILTDAAITKKALKEALGKSVENSFNCLTVDGDMSTNDTIFALANGESKNKTISDGKSFRLFCIKLNEVSSKLTKMLASDGEGATKIITVNVFKKGRPIKFSEINAKKVISKKEVEINININTGKESITVYTCDLTEDYIKVNAS